MVQWWPNPHKGRDLGSEHGVAPQAAYVSHVAPQSAHGSFASCIAYKDLWPNKHAVSTPCHAMLAPELQDLKVLLLESADDPTLHMTLQLVYVQRIWRVQRISL